MDARRLIVALTPGVMLAGVAGGIAFPILPIVGMRAGLPLTFIGAILAANRFVRVLVSPLVGMCVDRFGGKRTLLVGLAVQVVVTAFFVAGVETPYAGLFLLAGRLLHGFGSSCVFVSAQALALHGGKQGGRVGGAVRAAVQLGVPAGLVLGGLLSDWCGETLTFLSAAGALLAAMTAAWVMMPDLRVDAPKKASLGDSMKSFLDRRMASIGALGFASAFAGSGMVLTTTTILVRARHLSLGALPERTTASLLMGWLVVSEALSMSPLGRFGDRRDAHARVAFAGLAFSIPALIVLAFAEHTWSVALGMGMLGISVAALSPSLLALVGRIVAPERRGLGVGALQVATDIGGSTGPLVGTWLIAYSLSLPYLAAAVVSLLLFPFGVILVKTTVSEKSTPAT